MRLRLIEILAAIALTFAALVAFAKGGLAADVTIVNAVAAKSVTPQARTGAVYLTIQNTGSAADSLIAVATTAADAAMIHRSVDNGGVMHMDHVEGLAIAPGATVDFAASGYHVMLVGLKEALTPGMAIDLTLTFAHAGEVKLTAPVGDRPAPPPVQ